MAEHAVRRGGRPRDPDADEAILRAARHRLVRDGYSGMTIADIVADAGVTRPTLYRRWKDKAELVVDALAYGLEQQRASYVDVDWEALEPRDAFRESVRRLDPTYANPDAMTLHGNFMAEVHKAPELLQLLRDRAVGPRCDELLENLRRLRAQGAVRADVDLDTIVTLCFGAFFGHYLRVGDDAGDLVERVVGAVWPLLRAEGDHRG